MRLVPVRKPVSLPLRKQRGVQAMMVAILTTMLAALTFAWARRKDATWVAACLCLLLTVWLFLWEVWSPVDGFRMPWIDTRLERIETQAQA